ncbi:hypothetical protein ACSHWB_45750 [Lentzea sp. HUAS TT2]|uniref:hypothetical protein n=1 Tax=Lentzea sp. HUAS TT2 TaxID=3447454 RepID=UPI003F722724
MTTSSWGHRVTWPYEAAISVAAPRHQQTNGNPNPAWTEVVVTVTNGNSPAYRASTLRVEAYTNDRTIKPIVPDVAGIPLQDKTIEPNETFSFSLIFATRTLGRDLTLRWSSSDDRVRPITTFNGDVAP